MGNATSYILGFCIASQNQGPSLFLVSPLNRTTLNHSHQGRQVHLKVVPVLVRNGRRSLNTYAILDDGAECTIILTAAVQHLNLRGKEESLAFRTICHDVAHLTSSSVDFHMSSLAQPGERHLIRGAFTASRLALAEHSYPVTALQKCYRNLRGIPLPNYTRLIASKEHARLGPSGGPAAVHTQLGRALQGPDGLTPRPVPTQQCLLTSFGPITEDLYQLVEHRWQLDVLPLKCEKPITRSRHNQEAVNILESRTKRVQVGDALRHASPLLGIKKAPLLRTSEEAVMANLRSTERKYWRRTQSMLSSTS